MREISNKNYVLAFLIIILTIVLTLFGAKTYLSYQNYNDFTLDFMPKLMAEELDVYIVESHDAFIYITSEENGDKKIQKQMKSFIAKHDSLNNIAYLNIDELNEDFISDFTSKYNMKNNYLEMDSLIIIKNGKVVKTLVLNEKNFKLLDDFVNNNFYGEND